MSKVLDVIGLEKVYGSRKASMTRAVGDVSFSVYKGEFVAIMGPSGSGKSTLINCVSTIDRPTSGEVIVDGKPLSSMSNKALSKFRSEELGFIFQDASLLDTLTCKENIALPLTIRGEKSQVIEAKCKSIAAHLAVDGVLDKFPYEISGGQAQRVAACRALVDNPKLMVADEPTGSLDSKNSRVLLESFANLNKEQQATILMVTHDVFAASWCERVLFLRDGKLYCEVIKGERSRKEFFEAIMDVVAAIGGGEEDVL